ncbi:peptidoglycan-binding protein, partial [filamentous cyanobacterium CCP1]
MRIRYLSHRLSLLSASPLFRVIRIGVVPIALVVLSMGQVPANSQSPEANQPSTESQASPSSSIRPVLTLGSEGDSVSELQAMLKLLGYYSGAVDGVYRASTAAAVSAFQQAVGLQADGVAGPDTWNRLLPASPAAVPVETASSPS